MGNWHCVTSDCAKVVYREYQPPSVRYRYPGEDWQFIEGADDYTIEGSLGGQCEQEPYNLRASCEIEMWFWTNFSFFRQGVVYPSVTASSIVGSVKNVRFESWLPCPRKDPNQTTCTYGGSRVYAVVTDSEGEKWFRCLIWTQSPFTGGVLSVGHRNFFRRDTMANESFEFELVSGEPDNCGDCVFTVYQNGQIVHTETRSDCPEVEVLDCHLSDEYKEVTIDKFPYLERVEVVPYAYQNLGLNVYQAKIPDECLNIYKNLTTTIIPQFEGLPTPTNAAQASYGYITQICSTPGCPPPEYQVICDCNSCESCPEGTCAVECGDHICCYGDDGVAVKSINKENYCNG